MASLETRCSNCYELQGERREDVNLWMDEYYKSYGQQHRFVRHHNWGIQEAEALFSEREGEAAIVHILRDCGHIPTTR